MFSSMSPSSPHIQYAHSSLADHQEFQATYWQHEEIKGGYSELVDRGLEVGIDAVDLDGLNVQE